MATIASPIPFFIVGFPRSGTTLLASLLGRHPDIAMPPETHLLNRTAKSFQFDSGPMAKSTIMDSLENNPRLADLEIDLAELNDLPEQVTLPEVFLAVLRHYARRANCRYVAEKTPNYMDHAEYLIGWFPDAPIIWLIRDGRDVVPSLQKVPWTHSSVRRHSLTWVKQNQRMGELAKKHSSILLVKYEDLLLNPESELRRIHEHLSIPYCESQLVAQEQSAAIPEWEKPWKSNASSVVDASRAYAWKKNAIAGDLEAMESIMHDTLEQYGYPSSPNKWGRVRFLKHWPINKLLYLLYETPMRRVLSRIQKTVLFRS